jgi:hypothetical protein
MDLHSRQEVQQNAMQDNPDASMLHREMLKYPVASFSRQSYPAGAWCLRT